MAGFWKSFKRPNQPVLDTMLLLSDGSVIAHEYDTSNWHKLVADALSDYTQGTWHKLTPQPPNAPVPQGGPINAPLYFASAVLKNGHVFVAGGEYNSGVNHDILAAEIYDPVADSWTSIPDPPGFGNIGDAPTCVLPDGRVLLGNINSTETVILDPVSKSWSLGGSKHDNSSEESWTLMADATILCAEVDAHPKAEKYLIATNTWVGAGSVPPGHDLVLNEPGISIEIGPAILMNDGRVFCVGATGHTALYTPPLNPADPGSWTAGPDFPVDGAGNLLRAFDAPAALLPNGNVLCIVGRKILAGPDAGWSGLPIDAFEFDGVNLTKVASPTNAAGTVTFNCRLLLLPTGQVLLSNCTDTLEIYTPSGGPNPAWRPQITSVDRRLQPGGTYKLHGRQINGRSQANAYGDDAQMATNYPIVRLRGGPVGATYYCRTFDHSTMAVATGNQIHHTNFVVPTMVPFGDYELTVIANGIPSDPCEIHVQLEDKHEEHHEPRDCGGEKHCCHCRCKCCCCSCTDCGCH